MKKEKAIEEFIAMIKNSWTYDKMTTQEKKKMLDILNNERTIKSIKGNTTTRWNILQAIYFTYLEAIGYSGFNWRDENDD